MGDEVVDALLAKALAALVTLSRVNHDVLAETAVQKGVMLLVSFGVLSWRLFYLVFSESHLFGQNHCAAAIYTTLQWNVFWLLWGVFAE